MGFLRGQVEDPKILIEEKGDAPHGRVGHIVHVFASGDMGVKRQAAKQLGRQGHVAPQGQGGAGQQFFTVQKSGHGLIHIAQLGPHHSPGGLGLRHHHLPVLVLIRPRQSENRMLLAQKRQVSGNFAEKFPILNNFIIIQADQDLGFQQVSQYHGKVADGAVPVQGQKVNPGLLALAAKKILQERQMGRIEPDHRIGEGRGSQYFLYPGLHRGAEFRGCGGGHHCYRNPRVYQGNEAVQGAAQGSGGMERRGMVKKYFLSPAAFRMGPVRGNGQQECHHCLKLSSQPGGVKRFVTGWIRSHQ